MPYPLPKFAAQYKPVDHTPSKPIIVGRVTMPLSRLSIQEAKELYTQLGMAIHMAEYSPTNKVWSITPRGLMLNHHSINGVKYFTCSNM